MRIAAFADIHSNVFALKAVISDAEQRGADLMLNLGDIFYGPIAPRATYEFLMEHQIMTIRGNQDRQICEATPEEIKANPTMRFVLDDLGQIPLNWMKALPFDKQIQMKSICVMVRRVTICAISWRMLRPDILEYGLKKK